MKHTILIQQQQVFSVRFISRKVEDLSLVAPPPIGFAAEERWTEFDLHLYIHNA